MGRKAIGERAMTGAERQARHRLKQMSRWKFSPDPFVDGYAQGRLSVIDGHLMLASKELRMELAAICVRLGSDNKDDRASAALEASEMVRQCGRQWLELLGVDS